MEYLVNYGLMMVSICEKYSLNHLFIEIRGLDLINQLLENSKHSDYKVAITAQRLLLYMIEQESCYKIITDEHVKQIMKMIEND